MVFTITLVSTLVHFAIKKNIAPPGQVFQTTLQFPYNSSILHSPLSLARHRLVMNMPILMLPKSVSEITSRTSLIDIAEVKITATKIKQLPPQHFNISVL